MKDECFERPNGPDAAAVLFTLVWPSLVTWVCFVLFPEHAPGSQKIAVVVGKSLQFAFPLVWVLAIQRRRPRWRGAQGRAVAEGLVFGAFVVLAAAVLYLLWLRPIGYFVGAAEPIRKRVAGFGVTGAGSFVVLGVFYSLVHSFLEEYYWRWFVFGQLRRWLPLGPAVAVASLGFMAHHVIILGAYLGWFSPATWLFSLAVAVGGGVWAWMYQRSGSLWGPWASHLLVDAAIFTVGYDVVRHLLGG